MSLVIVTGSAGLVGSATVRHFCARGFDVVGIDNDMRQYFFGPEASTTWNRLALQQEFPTRYRHEDVDVRDAPAIERLFASLGSAVAMIVHAAAQPSHDWAAREPATDFSINAVATLNLLEAARQHCPETVFIFTSTNKVYGDTPNTLPLVELPTRWEIEPEHRYAAGIDETMSIDASRHSLFGASKAAADLLVQEYGRYFGMRTSVFRGGCLTGPDHSGVELHGFLAYLMKCTYTGTPYTIYGYKGKQVRDNIHSEDLAAAFECVFNAPRQGEVYNIGGSRFAHCSILEAITMCEEIAGRPLVSNYTERNRLGDHIWYVSDIAKFHRHYPEWRQHWGIRATLTDIFEKNVERWRSTARATGPM